MTLSRDELIEVLSKKYPNLSFVPTTVRKNGDVMKDAICVKNDSNIAPTIYMDSLKTEDIDEAVEVVTNIINQNASPNINISLLTDSEFICDHVRIGIQKESEEEMVKKPAGNDLPGVEQYLYIHKSESGENYSSWSVKIKLNMLEQAGLEEEKVWEIARRNTFNSTTLRSMTEVMSDIMGEDFDEIGSIVSNKMFIVSNREQNKGASAILNHEMLKKFALEHCPEASDGSRSFVVLPSSIHECILLPTDGTVSIDEFSEMVKEVNATQLQPEEVLVDHAFIITIDD